MYEERGNVFTQETVKGRLRTPLLVTGEFDYCCCPNDMIINGNDDFMSFEFKSGISLLTLIPFYHLINEGGG